MEKKIIDRYRSLAKEIMNDEDDFQSAACYMNEAKRILEDDFKEQVIDTFGCYLEDTDWSSRKPRRDEMKEITPVEFTNEFNYDDKTKDFINGNWNDVGKMIDILREYAEELDKQYAEAKEGGGEDGDE